MGWREPTQAPERLVSAIRAASERRGLMAPVEVTIEAGSRNSTLFSRARSLFAQGYNDVVVSAAISTLNRIACIPPLDDEEVFSIVESAGSEKYERGELSPSSSPKSIDSDDTLPQVKMFRDMTPPTGPRPYIVNGVLFEGFPGAFYGDGGSAKSMLVMHMGQCVARGKEWLGFDTVKTRVLYLDFELDEEEQSRRAYQVAAGDGYTEPPEGFFYLSGAGYPTRAMFEHALNVCSESGIGMVIVDSLGYALEGDAEASRDVLKFFREVEGAFRQAGITLLIVDHQAKQHGGVRYQDKTMFGSVYKSNSTRSVFQVEPSAHEEGSLSVIVRHKKANFGPLLNPFGVEVRFVGDEEGNVSEVTVDPRELDATELVGEGTLNAKDRVLMALEEGPMYPADIAETTKLELGTVKNALTSLRRKKLVENTGNRDVRGSNEVRLVSSPSSPLSDDDSDTCEESQDSQEDDDTESDCECEGRGCIHCLKQELPFGAA